MCLTTNIECSVVQQAFCPPPFQSVDQEKLECYVHHSAQWHKTDQLLVCFSSPRWGSLASKQRICKWIAEANSVAYEELDLPLPLVVSVNSTKSMAACRALLSGVSLQEVYNEADWASPYTFIRFYMVYMDSTPASQVLMS